MDTEKILGACDHTLLKQEAGFEDIKKLIDEAVEYKTASVCIPPCFVKKASEYAQGRTKICTVIGFPNGYSTTEVKVFETSRAVDEGADEIDMVINIGMLKSGNDDFVMDEINRIKEACSGRILKVIVETCLLTEEEKIRICDIVNRSNADYIKTSTGFSTGGATFEDIELMAKHMDPGKGIKASGGISTLEDAQKFLDLGATRLGTSRIVKLVKG
ncbi:deoxyribose-phosphate aldolase [Lachnospiraceae bacterium XBB2008]|nr:deoxyribose-phosphate aldolase [Lachnospiraceae bacterium XBB2008]